MTTVIGGLLAVALVYAAFIALRRAEWALVLIIGLYAFEQVLQSYVPALVATSWLTNAFVGGVAVVAIMLRIARQEPVFAGVASVPYLCLALIYCVQLLGILWCPDPEFATEDLRRGFKYLVVQLAVAPLLVSNLRSIRRMTLALLVFGTIVCVAVIINPSAGMLGGRLRIELGNFAGDQAANPLAIATVGGTIAVAGVLFQVQKGRTLLLMIRVAAIVSGLGLAILSGSRGQVLAAIGAMVLFYPLCRPLKDVKQFFATVIGTGMVLGLIMLSLRFFIGAENEERWSSESLADGVTGRLDNVTLLLGEWISRPEAWIFGLGPGAFYELNGIEAYVHNLLAEALGETGLVGFSLLMIAFGSVAVMALKLVRIYGSDPELRSTLAVLFGILAFRMVLTLKQGSMIFSPSEFTFLLITAKVCWFELRRAEQAIAMGEPLPALEEREGSFAPRPGRGADPRAEESLPVEAGRHASVLPPRGGSRAQ